LLDHPVLADLHAAGAKIHIRSAYLQGLILAEPSRIPEHLARLRPPVAAIRAFAAEHGVSTIVVALAFLRQHPVVDGVLIGATSELELTSTVEAWAQAATARFATADFDAPNELLDPRRWPGLEAAQR
jgi:aryl-alcohol dehydrogenase-like predicted oxidoreductase